MELNLEEMTLTSLYETYNVLEFGNTLRENENEQLIKAGLDETEDYEKIDNFSFIKEYGLKNFYNKVLNSDKPIKLSIIDILASLTNMNYASKLKIIYISDISRVDNLFFAIVDSEVSSEILSVHILSIFDEIYSLLVIDDNESFDEFKDFLREPIGIFMHRF